MSSSFAREAFVGGFLQVVSDILRHVAEKKPLSAVSLMKQYCLSVAILHPIAFAFFNNIDRILARYDAITRNKSPSSSRPEGAVDASTEEEVNVTPATATPKNTLGPPVVGFRTPTSAQDDKMIGNGKSRTSSTQLPSDQQISVDGGAAAAAPDSSSSSPWSKQRTHLARIQQRITKTYRQAMRGVLAEQLFFAPVINAAYVLGSGLLHDRPLGELLRREIFAFAFLRLWLSNVSFWGPVSITNFLLVPPALRLTVSRLASIVWTIWLLRRQKVATLAATAVVQGASTTSVATS
ncbi:unnamed protein product [Amoebophrya sp. A120]|nr:unnamed protein product [Amoebophrya sp. A120]|eukprot:GSA120T00012697001.1